MMDWLLIIGMMLLTFGPRYLPFALADKIKISPLLHQILSYVPIAVLNAIIAQSILIKDNKLFFSVSNPFLLSAACAFIAALLWQRLFLTITVGLCVYVFLKINLIDNFIHFLK